MTRLAEFIDGFQSLTLSTIDAKGDPFASYAPFIADSGHYYILISDIARHAANLHANPKAALFFIEAENDAGNIFARKRAVLQCKSEKISREDERFMEMTELFDRRFDPEMIRMLIAMKDFNLYRLIPYAGEAVFGFGEAYDIGGDTMDELIPRQNGGHSK